MQTKRCLIYLRISSDPLGLERGIERQREECERLCRARGWEVIGVLVDNDTSASGSRVRPDFDTLLRRVDAGEVSHVVAWDMTRLTRNARDTLRILESGKRAGITLAFAKGSDMDLSSADGRTMAGVIAQFAQGEIDKKSERQISANRQARTSGHMPWTTRPYGYTLAQGKIVPVPREAAALRAAMAGIMAREGLASVTRGLNAIGPNARGKKWMGTNVRRTLLRPRYVGKVSYNREVIGEGDWPAIFTVQEQEEMREVLSNPTLQAAQGMELRYLLSYGAICGVCGSLMRAQSKSASKNVVYQCADSSHLSRKHEPVDRAIETLVVARLSHPDGLALLTPDVDIQSLRRQAAGLRERRDGVGEMLAEGLLPPEGARPRLQEIKASLARLETAIATATGTGPGAPLAGVRPEDMSAAWKRLSVREKRTIVDALLTVTVLPAGRGVPFSPNQLQIDWRS